MEDDFERMKGRLAVMRACLVKVITEHKDLDVLSRQLLEGPFQHQATSLATAVSEAYLEGVEAEIRDVQTMLAKVRQSRPPTPRPIRIPLPPNSQE